MGVIESKFERGASVSEAKINEMVLYRLYSTNSNHIPS